MGVCHGFLTMLEFRLCLAVVASLTELCGLSCYSIFLYFSSHFTTY